MSYLSREASNLPEELWSRVDSAVVGAARRALTGRRFLPIYGPLGAGTRAVPVDDADALAEAETGGLITAQGRKFVQIPTVYEDFVLLARDLESAAQTGLPVDLSGAERAAERCALKEDGLVFFGSAELGYDGLLTVPGAKKIARQDWSAGENAFADVAAGVEHFTEKGVYGAYALAVSPDLYLQLQRLQPGTGLLEADRVAKLVDGRLYRTPVLGKGRAVLVACDAKNVDLAVGQDMAAAYLEQKDLNHSLRVVETVLPRIKRRDAVVVFE